MRNLKRYLALAVAIAMLFTLMVPAIAAESDYTGAAEDLYELGLYKGVNPDSFEPDLGASLDRQTGATMLLRMFGMEAEALAMDLGAAKEALAAKFTDASTVADWAAKQVAYATEKGIIAGFEDKTFGPKGMLTGQQYSTLVLNSLGYKGDFEFADAADKYAEVAGLTDEEKAAFGSTAPINKGVLVGASFAALESKVKGTEDRLIDVLVTAGVVTAEKAEAVGFVVTATPAPTATANVGAATMLKEVKVTAQDTMVAVFDGAVTTAATFAIDGAMVVNPTVTWNEAKTEATLKAQSVLLDGTYTVKVTAEGIAEGKDTATVVVAKNGIAKIEIEGDKLIRTSALNSTGAGFFFVKLTDTYGNDVTEKMAYDVTITTSKDTDPAELTIDPETGKVEFDLADGDEWDDYPAIPEVFSVTAYSNTVGSAGIATASKVLTVTEQSRVETIELGPVTFPGTATSAYTEKDVAAYVEIVAKDQFGYEVTDIDRLTDEGTDTEVVYSKSDADLLVTPEEYTDENGVEKVRLEIGTNDTGNEITEAKKITLSAISKFKGKVSNTVTLDIRVAKAPERIALGSPEKVMAEGDTYTETLVLPFTAYDVDGNVMSTDDVIDAYNAEKITFEISGEAAMEVKVATSGDNKGKIVSAMTGLTEGSETLVVELPESKTMRTATKVLTVKDRAYATSLEINDVPATRLLSGADTDYNYNFFDQYGREMNADMLNDGTDYTQCTLTVTSPSGFDGTFEVAGLTLDDTTTTVTVDADDLTTDSAIAFTAGTEDGTARLKVELFKDYGTTSLVDSDTRSFAVAEGIPSGLTFDIETIPTLYATTATATSYVDLGTNVVYGMPLKLVAKDTSGNTYAVPFTQVLSVGTSDNKVFDVTMDTSTTDMVPNADGDTEHDDKVVVWGTTWSDEATSKTATLTVNFKTEGVPQAVTKTITVSKETPRVVDIMFIDQSSTDVYSLPDDYEVVEELVGTTGAGVNALSSASAFSIVTKNQYGIYSYVADLDTLTIANPGVNTVINKTTVGITELDGTSTEADDIDYRIANDDFVVADTANDEFIVLMYTDTVSGKYATLKIKVTNGTM